MVLAAPIGASAKSNELAPKHAMKNLQESAAANDASGKANRNRTSSNGISYHGGPVVTGTANAYVIWYGTWTSTTPTLVDTYLGHVGGSPYYNINTTYYNGSGTHVSNSVALPAETSVTTYKKSLSDSDIYAIVSNSITSGALPKDANGIYFVLTSADVAETSGFLTQYCGWHTHGSVSGTDIKYAFVGDASANLAACAVQTSVSPNNNPAGDAMISVIAHELEEATSDPDLNAWYDSRGYENADKCAWTFGTTYTVANGSKANMNIGGLNFLVQRNWVNASGGYCALKL